MRRFLERDFTRYLVVQVAAYAVEWAIYAIGRALGWEIVPSNIGAKIAALCFAFFCHRNFTFRSREAGARAALFQGLRYLIAFAFNLAASTVLLVALDILLPEWIAKMLSDVGVVFASFLIARTLVFGGPKADDRPTS